MRVSLIVVALLASISSTNAFSIVDRRDVFRQAAAAATAAATAVSLPTTPANAINACPPKSKNCIRTTWTAPDGINIGESLVAIVDSYPQEGQNDVDKGGWILAEGDLKSSNKARYEFKSGIGKFAKFFNGGKPFIDDLEFEISGKNVDIRSSSRVGDSDFDVNKKRLLFLGEKATALGFTVPEPKY